MSAYQEVVKKIINNNLSLSNDASILVLTDESTQNVARKFYESFICQQWKIDFLTMSDQNRSGEEPPQDVAEKMLQYDVVFCLTKHSLTHTMARKNASKKGISVITMPGINEDMFLHGALNADYSRVEQETLEMAGKLSTAKGVVIRTGIGHELVISFGDRTSIASTGVFREKGASGNLPSGEAFIAPIEGEAEGSIVINGSIAGIGLLPDPIVLTISKGRLIDASTDVGGTLLQQLGNGDGRLLCELGIGTNYAARITGNILEDEKAYNTIHVAFGSNHTFGGKIQANVHIDCVTKSPQLEWL